ncbi:hypothetical protein [Niabella aurantiaca]|uniref:hypothetical protein n=1 Tax=Niabella aurantiaca TaxID=379900 RepID=UPI000369F00C|nr:hypothetical protein [Niabella aurantiaca]
MRRVLAIILLFFSISSINAQNCLTPAYYGFTGVDFNPEWIKKNSIIKIIEREYIDDDTTKLGLVNYLYFDSLGYISKEISGLRDPKTNLPSEADYFSIRYYTYEVKNGFLYQLETIVRKYGEKGLLEKQDTLPLSVSMIYNPQRLKERFENKKLVATYTYNADRCLSKIEEPGIQTITFTYKEGKMYSIKNTMSKEYLQFYANANRERELVYNSYGQIEGTSSTDGFSHKLYYNHLGEMIKQEDFSKGKYSGKYTFEYIRKK